MAVLDHDHHWPSLPPIRTTSAASSRVSCETLSLPCSPPSRSRPPSSSSSPFSARSLARCSHSRHCCHRSNIGTASSKPPSFPSADASPCSASAPSTATSRTSQFFSHCLPHRVFHTTPSNCFSPASHTSKGGKKSAARMLRSIIGFSPAAMNQYSPSKLQFSGTISPSASRMHAASGVAPNHSGPLLRSSKGHSANLFTMIPVEMVGKKKPPDGYQAEEPTSPEVTCMGRVRKKKAAFLIKDNLSARGKLGKVKKLGSDSPLRNEFNKQSSFHALDGSPKMLRQRSGRRAYYDLHGYDDALRSEPALSDELHKPLESLHLDVLPTSCTNVEDSKMATELSSTKDTPVLGSLNSDSVGVSDSEKLPEKQSIVLDWDVQNLIAVSGDQKAGDLQRPDVAYIGKSDPASPSKTHDRSLEDAKSTVREAKAQTAGDVIAERRLSEIPPPNCLLLMRNRSSSRSTSRSFP